MTRVSGDFDQMLRRALRAEADLIEPAEGGLDRIRQRTHAPWLVRQASLMLTECVDLARLVVIRLEPSFAGARAAVAARSGPWGAFVGVLSSTVSILAGLVMPSQRGHAAHRGGPGRPGGSRSRARARSSLSWLRPAVAVAGAVVIVVAGVLAVTQMRDKLVLELFPGSNPPASTGSGSTNSGHQVLPTLNGQKPTGILPPATTPSSSAKPSPKTTCSSSPSNQQASPTATPTPTPSPSATTPTPTPAPSPTESTPAATPSSGSAQPASSSTGTSSVQTVASVVSSATPCGSASPSSTPSS